MSYAPCENPNCKSYGKPHPNCRCHGGMAKGGLVEHFCSTSRAHKKDCKYFASGGDVVPDDMLPNHGDVVPDDLIPEQKDDVVPNNMLPEKLIPTSEKYGSVPQQILTGIEGAAQGILGPAATIAEMGISKLLSTPMSPNFGTTKEAIAGRQKENPNAHMAGEAAGMIGSVISGEGLPVLASKATAKMGSTFLKNAIPAMAISGSDEITKSLLGIGDPNEAAATVMASGFFGGVAGSLMKGAGDVFGKSAGWLAGESGKDLALGTYFQRLLKGVATGFNETYPNHVPYFPTEGMADATTKAYQIGQKLAAAFSSPHEVTPVGLAKAAVATGLTAAKFGATFEHAMTAALAGAGAEATLGAKSIATKYAAPVVLKVLSDSEGNFIPNFGKILDYAKNIEHGTQMISDKVNKIFVQPTVQQFSKKVSKNGVDIEKAKEILKKSIQKGGINQNIQEQIYHDNSMPDLPEFAEGGLVAKKPSPLDKGEVSPLLTDHDPVQKYFPNQNMILEGAKARVSNYLTSMQPQQNPQMLPFDRKPNQMNQEKKYDKALTVAVNPLSILDKIQSGRLTKEDMGNLNGMYPELQSHLQKQITKRIVEAQIKGEKPNKQSRQSLSFFMGAPMESTMKQPMIAAAQTTFSMQKQKKDQPQQTKQSTKSLGKASEQYKTSSDAGVSRTQTSKL